MSLTNIIWQLKESLIMNPLDNLEEKRHDQFNIQTNQLLGQIEEYLVNEGVEQYEPRYTSIRKKPNAKMLGICLTSKCWN